MVDVSVVVASRNGARMLPAVIAAIRASMAAYDGSSELILVDNASEDATPEIMRAAAEGYSDVWTVWERVPGGSRARNVGAACAKGAYVLFTDDDVIVPPNWITEMVRPFAEGATAVTGAVRLVESVRSRLSRFQQELLADTEASRMGDPPRTIIGANMGFRRDRVFDTGVWFDDRVGPGTPIGYSEDTVMFLNVTANGGTVAFVGSAVAEHRVAPNRLTDDMWHRRIIGQAVSESWVARHILGARPSPRMFVEGCKATARLRLRVMLGRPVGTSEADLNRLRRAVTAAWWTRELLRRRQKPVEDRWRG